MPDLIESRQRRELDRLMLTIQALDHFAHLDFSSYTGRWYVSANVEVGNGAFLTGITEHRGDPYEAVRAFFERLTSVPQDEYLVTKYCGHRREWRWNGAAFQECTRREVVERGYV
jgi:hypothetical protein